MDESELHLIAVKRVMEKSDLLMHLKNNGVLDSAIYNAFICRDKKLNGMYLREIKKIEKDFAKKKTKARPRRKKS